MAATRSTKAAKRRDARNLFTAHDSVAILRRAAAEELAPALGG